MNDFTKVDSSLSIPNTSDGVWKIEKKRKTRDRKGKQLKYKGSGHKDAEDDVVFTDIDTDSADDKEFEDQAGYGNLKTKKTLSTRIDLKI